MPSTAGRSGRGFERGDLKDPEKIFEYAKRQGIDSTRYELRVRCLSAALEAKKADRPGGMFVHLIAKGSRGDWSTIPDEHHEPAKAWLRQYERPAVSRAPPLFDAAPAAPLPIAAVFGELVSGLDRR